MHIGIVLFSEPGISETFFRNKINLLQENGFKVSLFVNKKKSTFNLCKVFCGFNSQASSFFFFYLFIKSILRLLVNPLKSINLWNYNKLDGYSFKENIQSLLLSSHIIGIKLDWLHFGFATVAKNRENLARVIGAKMAVSLRGYDMDVYPIKEPGVYDRLWPRIDKLHYISDTLLQKAIKFGFDPNVKHYRITPAINTEIFKFNESLFTSNLLSSEKTIQLTTIARLHWIKGLDYVFEALSKLKSEGINFKYILIGDGTDYEKLLYLRNYFDLNDNIIFLHSLNHVKIIEILKKTDIYIQYSIEEGFCNSVLEAQSLGCLCLVSNASGLTENIINGSTGFVISKMDSQTLFSKLFDIIHTDFSLLNQLRLNALYRVQSEFNLKIQILKFIEFYTT